MALGNERLYGEFRSDQGIYYKIRIYDSEYTGGTSNEFRCDSNGFILTYKGEGDDRYQPIKSSSIEFSFYVEGDSSTPTGAFIDLLKSAAQGRFKVEVGQGTNGTSYPEWWRGIIISDIVELEDESYPRKVKIKAVDGLSLMKDIPFNRDVYNGSFGQLKGLYSFRNIVVNLLRFYTGGIVDFFSSSQTFLREMVHWYEDSMPSPGSSNSPWNYSAMYPYGFMDVEYDGNTPVKETPRSAYDALEAILKCWGLRIFQQNGYWHIVHIDNWRNDNSKWYYRRLSYNSSELGSGLLALQYGEESLGNLNNTLNLTKLSGGVDEYYAPLKKSTAVYGNWTESGLYSEQLTLSEWVSAADMDANLIDLGYIDNSSEAYLSFNQTFAFTAGDASGVDVNAMYDSIDVVYMIKVGNYYWDKNNNEWTTTQKVFNEQIMFAQGLFYNNTWVSTYNYTQISFVTANPPVSGEAKFLVRFNKYNAQTADGDTYYNNYGVVLTAQSSYFDSIIQYLIDGQSSIERIFTAIDSTSTSNEVMDLGNMLIGDGPTTSAPSWGRIRIYNGSSWQNTIEEDWQAWQAGNTGRITKILTEENFSGQREFIPLRQYIFRVNYLLGNPRYFGPMVALKDVNNNNDIMVMNGYKFNAGNDTITGEYWRASGDFSNITSTLEEPYDWGNQGANGTLQMG